MRGRAGDVDLRANVLNTPSQQPCKGTSHCPAVPMQDLLILAEKSSHAEPNQLAKAKTVSFRHQTKRRSKAT
jgi:hypothetical protein